MNAPLVLLPGMMCDSRVFQDQFTVLSRETSVTVAPVAGISKIETLGAELLGQLPNRFALVGHCFGGNVAMEILQQAPDRVERLCLMSTSPLAETPVEAAAREPWIVRAQAGRLQEALGEALRPEYLAAGPGRAAVAARMLEMGIDLGVDLFVRQMRAMQRRRDYQATLRRCKVPTLIISGAQDNLTPPRRHNFMAELIPGAVMVTLENAGHVPSLEQPERITALWRDWLTAPYVLT